MTILIKQDWVLRRSSKYETAAWIRKSYNRIKTVGLQREEYLHCRMTPLPPHPSATIEGELGYWIPQTNDGDWCAVTEVGGCELTSQGYPKPSSPMSARRRAHRTTLCAAARCRPVKARLLRTTSTAGALCRGKSKASSLTTAKGPPTRAKAYAVHMYGLHEKIRQFALQTADMTARLTLLTREDCCCGSRARDEFTQGYCIACSSVSL